MNISRFKVDMGSHNLPFKEKQENWSVFYPLIKSIALYLYNLFQAVNEPDEIVEGIYAPVVSNKSLFV